MTFGHSQPPWSASVLEPVTVSESAATLNPKLVTISRNCRQRTYFPQKLPKLYFIKIPISSQHRAIDFNGANICWNICHNTPCLGISFVEIFLIFVLISGSKSIHSCSHPIEWKLCMFSNSCCSKHFQQTFLLWTSPKEIFSHYHCSCHCAHHKTIHIMP